MSACCNTIEPQWLNNLYNRGKNCNDKLEERLGPKPISNVTDYTICGEMRMQKVQAKRRQKNPMFWQRMLTSFNVAKMDGRADGATASWAMSFSMPTRPMTLSFVFFDSQASRNVLRMSSLPATWAVLDTKRTWRGNDDNLQLATIYAHGFLWELVVT